MSGAAKSNKNRQSDFKSRMRKKGFYLLADWVHQDDKKQVKELIACLRKKRI